MQNIVILFTHSNPFVLDGTSNPSAKVSFAGAGKGKAPARVMLRCVYAKLTMIDGCECLLPRILLVHVLASNPIIERLACHS